MIQLEKEQNRWISQKSMEVLLLFYSFKTVHGTWESGNLGGQVGAQWKTLVVSTGSGNQDIGMMGFL